MIAMRFAAKAGLKVYHINTKPRENVGENVWGVTVCAEIFYTLKINPPQNEDLSWKVKGAKFVSLDRQTSIMMVD